MTQCAICKTEDGAMAPYFVGDELRYACTRPLCRKAARDQIASGELEEAVRRFMRELDLPGGGA